MSVVHTAVPPQHEHVLIPENFLRGSGLGLLIVADHDRGTTIPFFVNIVLTYRAGSTIGSSQPSYRWKTNHFVFLQCSS